MPKINVLDRHVADLIAAGEVVERPASAAKELVENAVDAGATQVTVEIQNGGLTYLRVTDNGSGIAAEDVETAFLRHATSKLRTKEDLSAIGTMGFRGEALAAIASVSKIDIMTKTAEGEGVSLRLEAGTVLEKTPAGCPEGTTIVVRDLFYNTPARLKFMKRDTVESSQVAGTLQRQALAHPEVAFRLIKDGETVLQTAGNGDLHGTVYQVYGRQLAVDMLQVKSQWENMQLFGFVTKPTATRGNRNYQQFFVNNRPVKSRLMTAALEEAYGNQLMSGRFPSCVLCLDLPKNQVDVNVHPAKTEVKFANERAVFDAIRFGVLSALNKNPGRPEMQLTKNTQTPAEKPPVQAPAKKPEPFRTMNVQEYKAFAEALSAPVQKPVAPNVAKAIQIPKAQAGFVSRVAPVEDSKPAPMVRETVVTPKPLLTPVGGMDMRVAANKSAVESRQKGEEQTIPVVLPDNSPLQGGTREPMQETLPMPEMIPYRVVGEVLDTYIIIEQGDAVLFLDKHAAHERILFEDLKKSDAPVMSQLLLAPITANVTREEAGVLLENRELLTKYGYEIEDFGDGALLIRQFPADLDESQAERTLEELADRLLAGAAADPGSMRDELLHTIACKAAIKAGWHTEPTERDALVRQVMERDDIKYCPHGRPVITTLTKTQLEKQFKR